MVTDPTPAWAQPSATRVPSAGTADAGLRCAPQHTGGVHVTGNWEDAPLWGMDRPGRNRPHHRPQPHEVSCPRLREQGSRNVGASAGSLAPKSSVTCFADATSGPCPHAALATNQGAVLAPLALHPGGTRSCSLRLRSRPLTQTFASPQDCAEHRGSSSGGDRQRVGTRCQVGGDPARRWLPKSRRCPSTALCTETNVARQP